MAVAEQPQGGLWEAVIEDATVEELLEKRQKAKESAKAVAKRARDADAAAKVALEGLDLGTDAPVRIGRFVVARKVTASRSVSFETAPGVRMSIKPLPEE
jgi:hypothetical protein